MAMRIEELRVGNLVMYRNVLCKIFSIHSPQPMKNKRFSDKAYVDIWCNSIVSVLLSELEQIPLTEEWLIELGFVDDDGDFLIDVDDRTCIHINLNRKRTLLESYDGIITLKMADYVHQVQNLYFELKREELK